MTFANCLLVYLGGLFWMAVATYAIVREDGDDAEDRGAKALFAIAICTVWPVIVLLILVHAVGEALRWAGFKRREKSP